DKTGLLWEERLLRAGVNQDAAIRGYFSGRDEIDGLGLVAFALERFIATLQAILLAGSEGFLAVAFDEADRLHGVAGHLNNGVGDVLLSGAAERFVMRAGGDHDIVHVRDVILAGHFRLLLRIHFAIVHVSAGIGVFRGQILEGLVRG